MATSLGTCTRRYGVSEWQRKFWWWAGASWLDCVSVSDMSSRHFPCRCSCRTLVLSTKSMFTVWRVGCRWVTCAHRPCGDRGATCIAVADGLVRPWGHVDAPSHADYHSDHSDRDVFAVTPNSLQGITPIGPSDDSESDAPGRRLGVELGVSGSATLGNSNNRRWLNGACVSHVPPRIRRRRAR